MPKAWFGRPVLGADVKFALALTVAAIRAMGEDAHGPLTFPLLASGAGAGLGRVVILTRAARGAGSVVFGPTFAEQALFVVLLVNGPFAAGGFSFRCRADHRALAGDVR